MVARDRVLVQRAHAVALLGEHDDVAGAVGLVQVPVGVDGRQHAPVGVEVVGQSVEQVLDALEVGDGVVGLFEQGRPLGVGR